MSSLTKFLPFFSTIGWPQVVVLVALIAALVLIAIYGRMWIQVGKKKLGFGGKSRSCRDCIMLTFTKREEHELKRRKLENSILKEQMNFAEHKILAVILSLVEDYRENLVEHRGDDVDQVKEHEDLVLYDETLKNSMNLAKDELRRSFKENGFYDLSGTEFSNWVKGKTKDLIALTRSYLRQHYPYQGMIIPIEERFDRLDEGSMEDVVFEIYVNAKEVYRDAHEDLDRLDTDFITDIYNFAGIQQEENNA